MEENDKIIAELKRQLTHSKHITSGSDQVAMQQMENNALKYEHINVNATEISSVGAETSQIAILTNALLEKQAVLEAVTTEKNTLVLKLEKMEVHISFFIRCTFYPLVMLIS